MKHKVACGAETAFENEDFGGTEEIGEDLLELYFEPYKEQKKEDHKKRVNARTHTHEES